MNNFTQINPSDTNNSHEENCCRSKSIARFSGAFADRELLEGIRNRNNKVLEYIYEQWYPMILELVTRHSGNADDAQDIFQDAMVVVYNKIKNDELDLVCALKTYFYSICKRLSYKLIKQKNKHSKFDMDYQEVADTSDENSEAIYENEIEKISIYRQHLLNLTDDARKLLQLYLNNHSLKEICEVMGYNSESYAKSRKYNIKEDLKKRILNDPYYQSLYDACA